MWANSLFDFVVPFSEFWLPLAIGLCVGSFCVVMAKHILPRQVVAAPPKPKPYFDPFEQGSTSEQRKFPRRGGNPTEVYYALPQNKHNPIRAWVLDRSVGGLCLWTGEPIPEAAILSILPINSPPLTPWIDIEVCNCRPHDKGFEIGCKFVKSPPSLILLQFG